MKIEAVARHEGLKRFETEMGMERRRGDQDYEAMESDRTYASGGEVRYDPKGFIHELG